ncbi:hypothetical protein AWZ03_000602 [Drosophila navojoa]|uniref:Uncharacterized protein n=1 Tax=Drosophila navojoa TaxID=7232 RepID=A0A484BW53_DRONA|nr:hypothetical protein AWZ03_000602 [Drosophila navojoa]
MHYNSMRKAVLMRCLAELPPINQAACGKDSTRLVGTSPTAAMESLSLALGNWRQLKPVNGSSFLKSQHHKFN